MSSNGLSRPARRMNSALTSSSERSRDPAGFVGVACRFMNVPFAPARLVRQHYLDRSIRQPCSVALESGLSHILPRIDLFGGVRNALERIFVCLLIDLRLFGVFSLLRALMLSFSHVLSVSRYHHQRNCDRCYEDAHCQILRISF